MAGFKGEEFSFVVYGANLLWVDVFVGLFVFGDGVVGPGSFPEPETRISGRWKCEGLM